MLQVRQEVVEIDAAVADDVLSAAGGREVAGQCGRCSTVRKVRVVVLSVEV